MAFTSKTGIVFGFVLLLTACDPGPKRAPAIGEAFVGPHTLQIRSDFTTQSKPLATVRHGERVAILQQRRRVVRVRTEKGAEGWVDERQLLSASDMAELRELAATAKALPSQGKATSYIDLNVHTQPARQAPSFVQLKEGATAEMLLYRMVPRTDVRRRPLIPPPAPKEKKAAARKPAREPKVPPPPMPTPPGPPPDWLDLSKTNLEDDDDPQSTAETAPPAPQPVPMERWSLIRVPGGAAGWVLSRLLTLAIPDDVAQYAEGKRIVAYLPLGEAQGDGKKYHWLWTTAAHGPHDYDFDSFRVFIWNNRRGRYETSYIERKVTGFLPVLPLEVDRQKRKVPGFSLCVLNREGQRVRREFAFAENRVWPAGEQPCEAPLTGTLTTPQPASPPVASQPGTPPKGSALERLRERIKSAVRGVFGR